MPGQQIDEKTGKLVQTIKKFPAYTKISDNFFCLFYEPPAKIQNSSL
jgi:hypothetical protein